MSNSQLTTLVYGDNTVVRGWIDDSHTAWVGSTVKASRGHANVISTGVVTDGWDSWISNLGGNVRVWGIDTTLPSIPGDSGSPVFMESHVRVAAGILNNSVGNVTFIDSCYEEFGPDGCVPWDE